MNNIISQLTSDPSWPKFCVHNKNESIVDGNGCTEGAYLNFTKVIDNELENLKNKT